MADINTGTGETAESRRQKQIAEYGTYVCDSADGISVDGAHAFNTGDPVPASHPLIEEFLSQGLVKKVKGAAQAAVKPKV